jgi:glycopeptide antibiotics resistance protein
VQPQRTISWARPLGIALTASQLAIVGWLASRPSPGAWVAAGSITPLHTIHAYLALGTIPAIRHLGGSLALLAPLGVLLPMAGGRLDSPAAASFTRTVFAGLMLAFGISVIRTGVTGQLFDTDTLLLNTAGVALAHLLLVPAGRAALRRRVSGRAAKNPAGQSTQAPAPALPRVGATP